MPDVPTAPDVELSPREVEVVRLLIAHMPRKCIAVSMGISIGCVNQYIRRVRVKYGADDVYHLMYILGVQAKKPPASEIERNN